jgi:hypothetical protein
LTQPDTCSDKELGFLQPESIPEEFQQLTSQEKLFGVKYCENFRVPKAGAAVGLSVVKARELLMRPVMRRYINWISDQLAQTSLINKQLVEAYMLDLVPKVTGEEEVPHIFQGEEVWGKKFDAPAAIRLGAELGKISGLVEETGGVAININFGALGIAEGTDVESKTRTSEIIEGEVVE